MPQRRSLLGLACAAALPVHARSAEGPLELLWLGQSCFRITTPGGKVLVTDPWLMANPRTPPEYKKLEALGRVDAILVSHGHADHFADAPALARLHNIPLRAPGDMNAVLGTLGVLPAALLPRFNKGGTIEPAAGVFVTAVRAEHSSVVNHRHPETGRDEVHYAGEPLGYVIRIEDGRRIYFAGDTAVFGDMRLIGERHRPDIALVPIGGHFTMDPADAAYALREMLKPRIAIPMHYGANPLAKGTAAEFVEAMKGSGIEVIVAEPGRALKL